MLLRSRTLLSRPLPRPLSRPLSPSPSSTACAGTGRWSACQRREVNHTFRPSSSPSPLPCGNKGPFQALFLLIFIALWLESALISHACSDSLLKGFPRLPAERLSQTRLCFCVCTCLGIHSRVRARVCVSQRSHSEGSVLRGRCTTAVPTSEEA